MPLLRVYIPICQQSAEAAIHTGMVTRGFGTEKIEDEIKIVFPDARVARMDQDTTRNKNSFNKIIKAFEEQQDRYSDWNSDDFQRT